MKKTNSYATLDLNLLRVFQALMAEGNVTRAAVRLNRTQSAISGSLARLREAFDDPLFEKGVKGMVPTSRGYDLWQQLEPHCLGIEEAVAPLSFDPSRHAGRFQLAMSDYVSPWVIAPLIQELEQTAPGVRINLLPFSVPEIVAHLERGFFDVTIGTLTDDVSLLAGLRTMPLWPVRWRCVMRRDHPLARGELTLKRYLQARHLDILMPGMVSAFYDTVLAAHGVQRRLGVTLNNFAPALSILATSDLIASMPTPIKYPEYLADLLCERDLPIEAKREVGLTWHSRNEGDRAHQWFRQLLGEMFSGKNAPAG